MPSNSLTLRAMAYNNAWANHRLLLVCAALSQAEFEAPRTSFFVDPGNSESHSRR